MYDMHIVGANWNVLAFVHLGTLRSEFISLQTNVQTVSSLCRTKLESRSNCVNIASHLRKRLDTMGEKNGLITHQHRTKRATLDFVESTLNVLKHHDDELAKQSKIFNDLVDQVRDKVDLIEDEQNFNDIVLHIQQIMSEYERQQDTIIHVVADSHRNLLNHGILSISQMAKQVELIKDQVGMKFMIPSGVDIFAISEVMPFLVGNQYIFKIVIPLLKPDLFGTYRIFKIPIRQNEKFLWIQLNSRFLLASNDRQYYQLADDLDIFNCNRYKQDDLR
ncbi:uncharacterized protein LOC116351416, partial [Contarinia nasturtii]|uniref:uncharacterized protein LOC116351416 n=1 Tax=Contarinia nasturtii TaxID=265458 RepID=UPI0012D3AAFD